MYPYFKKKFIIPVAAAGMLFVGTSFREDFFEIAKQIEIFTTLFKAVNTNYVDETNPGDLMDKAIKSWILTRFILTSKMLLTLKSIILENIPELAL